MEAMLAGGWLVSGQGTNSLWILRAALAHHTQPQWPCLLGDKLREAPLTVTGGYLLNALIVHLRNVHTQKAS